MSLNVGTPDNQRGIFSPQMVIGNFGAVAEGTVAIPANAQSLLVFTKGASTTATFVSVVGTTTGFNYPSTDVNFKTAPPYEDMYVVTVTPGVDQEVTITWSAAPASGWVVVADTGVRAVVDMTLFALAAENGGPALGAGLEVFGWDGTDDRQLLTDSSGRLIVTPIGANAHAHGTVANVTTILNAPAAGTVNRIYQCLVSVALVSESVNLQGVTSSALYGVANEVTAAYAVAMYFGGPIDAAEALQLTDTSNNQNITYSLHYRNMPAT